MRGFQGEMSLKKKNLKGLICSKEHSDIVVWSTLRWFAGTTETPILKIFKTGRILTTAAQDQMWALFNWNSPRVFQPYEFHCKCQHKQYIPSNTSDSAPDSGWWGGEGGCPGSTFYSAWKYVRKYFVTIRSPSGIFGFLHFLV